MNIEPIAEFHSPLTEKFGIPRQAGLVPELRGTIRFLPPYNVAEALRGLDGFDYVWLIWGFHLNSGGGAFQPTVRPPRLGGNERTGVFACRSPFRPNGLGLSSVRIESIDVSNCGITVLGADLADGTPIDDVKPSVEYADSHRNVRSGFVDSTEWKPLDVHIPEDIASSMTPERLESLRGILAQDPRPRYQHDSQRIYGLSFDGRNIRFRVEEDTLDVLEA